MQIDYKNLLHYAIRPAYVKDVWNAGFRPLFPFVIQEFPVRSLMPAVLYLMRWSKRRGKGEFFKKFHDEQEKSPSANTIAKRISSNKIKGFDNKVKKDILGDALIAYCLENRKRSSDRRAPVIRAYPTHYFSSWIDLPVKPANLRDVPEAIVSMLVNQNKGRSLHPDIQRGFYKTLSGFDDNLLLKLYGNGVYVDGDKNSKSSDKFDEHAAVGIDELLTIRIAQFLENAPLKSANHDDIINIHPVAKNTSRYFFEDFNLLIRNYYDSIPRPTLTPMIESCISLGITSIFLSLADIALFWMDRGKIKEKNEQRILPLLVDCSRSSDRSLRMMSETMMEDITGTISKLPVITMIMKIIEFLMKEIKCKDIPGYLPYPTEHLNFLGEIFHERNAEARKITDKADGYCNSILSELSTSDEHQNIRAILEDGNMSPVQRLAETTVLMMGNKLQNAKFLSFLDSAMMANDTNPLCIKRNTTVNYRSTIKRSVNLSNNALEYLVHRHLKKDNNKDRDLNLIELLDILRERYGLYIAEAPEGYSFSSLNLRNNRMYFENQLRDLGLFTGVNDSETMKRLKPRFKCTT